jgi:hypothetical protein
MVDVVVMVDLVVEFQHIVQDLILHLVQEIHHP